MSKYLICIIIGIILYLLFNDRNGFSVGVKYYQLIRKANNEIVAEIDSLDNMIEVENYFSETYDMEEYYIKEFESRAQCASFLGQGSVKDIMPDVDVNMAINDGIYCNPAPNCELLRDESGKSIIDDIFNESVCYNFCANDPRFQEECEEYHTYKSCFQKCPLEEVKNDVSQNLENAGFMKVDQLFNINGPESQEFIGIVNALGIDAEGEKLDNIYNGLTFKEYLLKQYLEFKLGERGIKFVKKISNNIFYINGQIYIYTLNEFILRVAHKFEVEGDLEIHDDSHLYEYVEKNLTIGRSDDFNTLHADNQNFMQFEVLPEDPLSKYETECKYRGIPVEGKTGQQIESLMLHILEDFSEEFFFINIWVLLYGSPNVRTVGFIDAIDDNKPNEVNDETTWQMIRDTTDPDSLISAFHFNIYPNVYNAETKENTRDDTKPDIDVSKLYTYDMYDGDALVFRTDSIPHIGYSPVNRDGLRVSGESRYALLEKRLVISKAYVITSMNPPSLEKVDSSPNIPKQIEDIVYSYFREEFQLFLEVYNSLGLDSSQKERLPLDIQLFERFMNETPYDKYYYEMDLWPRRNPIYQFLQKNLG